MKIKCEYEFLNKCFDDLFPILRSITGPGLEQSFKYINQYMPLSIEKVSTGTKVFDWIVPPEWHLKKATLIAPDGTTICDTDTCNLHVVNYSEPVSLEMTLEQLEPHLHSLPHLPDAVPYVTSYYARTWGFCLQHSVRKSLKPGIYKILIDSEFRNDGGVPYAYSFIEGKTKKEILISSYLCHPSLANNELSGPLVSLMLYLRMKSWGKTNYSYRFLLNPETIGSLCFLHNYNSHLQEYLESGLILTCLGGHNNHLRYKKSRRGNSKLDMIFESLSKTENYIKVTDFTPLSGSDERQYCSPGFNLPVGQVARDVYGEFEGYHNSLDNKEYMDIRALIDSVDKLEKIIKLADEIGNPINLVPYGEPQLGKRGLYPNVNSPLTWSNSSDGIMDSRKELNSILMTLSKADGEATFMDIAEACDCTLFEFKLIVDKLVSNNVLKLEIK